jgi:starvation-inducible outer membrane lipoprotein
MAVVGLVMGILSVTLGLCCCYGLPFNLLGIVFSAVALAQIKNDPEHYQGRGLAIAGLVLSVLSFLLVGLLFVIGVAFNWEDIMRGLKR